MKNNSRAVRNSLSVFNSSSHCTILVDTMRSIDSIIHDIYWFCTSSAISFHQFMLPKWKENDYALQKFGKLIFLANQADLFKMLELCNKSILW